MTNWKTELDVSDIFHSGLPVKELATKIAERLLLLSVNPVFTEEEDSILFNFSNDFRDIVETVEEFDDLWEQLYDFADEGYRIWIKLF
jgi:hypothetical protein